MTRFFYKIILSLSLPLIPAIAFGQPAGFDQEILPNNLKVYGNVKSIKIKTYLPDSLGDTLGQGIPTEIQICQFDKMGSLCSR